MSAEPVRAESWRVHRERGTAAELHLRDLGGGRSIWLLTVDGPSLVLGSTQSDDVVDAAAASAAGVSVARRRSGGGAVWLDDAAIWIDVTIGRDDPLWSDDVSRSGAWLGQVFVGALAGHGLDGLRVVSSGEVGVSRRPTVCFAGVSPGEVVDAAGRKIVGVSQRRTREGARFQCVAYRRWDPSTMAMCLTDPQAALALDGGAVGTVPIDAEVLFGAVIDGLVAHQRFPGEPTSVGGV